MATIVTRKQGSAVSYQVKVRLKGRPARTATFQPEETTQLVEGKLGHLRLSEISPVQIAECRRLLATPTRRGKLRASATVVRYLAALSPAYSEGRTSPFLARPRMLALPSCRTREP